MVEIIISNVKNSFESVRTDRKQWYRKRTGQ